MYHLFSVICTFRSMFKNLKKKVRSNIICHFISKRFIIVSVTGLPSYFFVLTSRLGLRSNLNTIGRRIDA